ncbi:hypothetical protein ACF0H5_020383 [Mactra antiquata]
MNQDALVYELKKKLAEINVIAFKLGANMDHIECYRCHEKGHYANCCTFRPDECFNCHEKGHYAVNCPNKETTENNIDMNNQQGVNVSEQDLLREAIQSVDWMEFPTFYQQQPMYQPSQQTMTQPQPLIQPVQQTAGGSIQDKQIALAVLKELKEIITLLYPLKDLCEMMAKKQQSCSVQF